MINYKKLLDYEVNNFRNGLTKDKDYFNEITKLKTYEMLTKALNDAISFSARRDKFKYKDLDIVKDLVEDYYNFAKKDTIKDEIQFNNKFNDFTSKFKAKLGSYGKQKLKQTAQQYGILQKFVSMAFKYIYCFNDVKKENFNYCNLPLDQYTINWYKGIGKSIIKERFHKLNYAWSKLDKKLYDDIQNDIKEYLSTNPKYKIFYQYKKYEEINLKENKLETEFIVWAQENNNKSYNSLKTKETKINKYYNGIKNLI